MECLEAGLVPTLNASAHLLFTYVAGLETC
jgi:hypothetical protein